MITTNYKVDVAFVLLQEGSGKAVAIINVSKGDKVDITEKITTAIREDINADEVTMVSDEDIPCDYYAKTFTVDIRSDEEDEETYSEEYTLERVPVY